MFKLIGVCFVVYLGWITGIIQACLLIAAGVLTTVAGIHIG